MLTKKEYNARKQVIKALIECHKRNIPVISINSVCIRLDCVKVTKLGIEIEINGIYIGGLSYGMITHLYINKIGMIYIDNY